MNKKILIVISVCLAATLLISPVFAPSANSLLVVIKDIQTNVNTIVLDLATLYQKLWSADDSIKNDTSLITTTQTNLGEWTLPQYTPRETTVFYQIMRVMVTEGKAAQFTVTAKSVAYLNDAKIEVWVDVNDDNTANALALEVEMDSSTPTYGTATFVGNSFILRLNVHEDPGNTVPFDKEINWAYTVVAPPGVEITEDIWLPAPT